MTALDPGTSPRHPLILVVDDDREIRDLFEILLSDEGYHVITAVDGAQALRRARDERPDLILLDLMMPRVDGVAFSRAYREHGGRAPVILITATAPDHLAAVVEASGVVACIPKPFDVVDVLTTIASYVHRDSSP